MAAPGDLRFMSSWMALSETARPTPNVTPVVPRTTAAAIVADRDGRLNGLARPRLTARW
jgi:hypothetical protein